MMNKKANDGGIFISIVVGIALLFFGILVFVEFFGSWTVAMNSMGCNTQNVSNFLNSSSGYSKATTCLVSYISAPYFALGIFVSALSILVVRFLQVSGGIRSIIGR